MSKLIITAAVTGATHVPSLSPYFPSTPEEIVADAVGSARAGASVVHIHARNPVDSRPSSDIGIFQQMIVVGGDAEAHRQREQGRWVDGSSLEGEVLNYFNRQASRRSTHPGGEQ